MAFSKALFAASSLLAVTSVVAAGQTFRMHARGTIAGASVIHAAVSSGNRASSQGYLGIAVRSLGDNDVSTLHLKSTHGAQVTMVDHDGPACKAGLRERDVIITLNGTSIDGEEQVRRMLHELQPGRSVSLVVVRGGAEQTINTLMANREELEREAWEKHWVVPQPADDAPVAASDPSPATHSRFGSAFMGGGLLSLPSTYTGAKVDMMGAQLAEYFGIKDGKGLLVHDVDANSPAAQAGLHAGDVVTRINTISVNTKSAWMHAMRESKGHPVSLTVMRDRQEQTLTMVVDPKHRSQAEPPPPIVLRHDPLPL